MTPVAVSVTVITVGGSEKRGVNSPALYADWAVLDPALTGDYDLPLGDPRRPADSALIPPVVARWGLAVSFDETQAPAVIRSRIGAAELPLALPGRIAIVDPAAANCTLLADAAAARCRVGKGQVTLIADALSSRTPQNKDVALQRIRPGDLVLVKGSRGIGTDLVVAQLKAEFA